MRARTSSPPEVSNGSTLPRDAPGVQVHEKRVVHLEGQFDVDRAAFAERGARSLDHMGSGPAERDDGLFASHACPFTRNGARAFALDQ